MDTYNKYFNDAWKLLKDFHPNIDLHGETLDLSVKPKVSKAEWCRYMNAVHTVLKIGDREHFITTHVDRHGCQVYIKFIKA